MAVDRDSERMARYLIAKHGARAADVARKRARDLEDPGDTGAAAVWREIADAIEEILERPLGTSVTRPAAGLHSRPSSAFASLKIALVVRGR